MPKLDYCPEIPMALTIDQVAAEVQIGVNRCYELVDAKVIPAFRISEGNIRVPRDLLQVWCAARALEETYGDGAGGYNIPPLLQRLLVGTLADDAATTHAVTGPRRRGPVGARRRSTA